MKTTYAKRHGHERKKFAHKGRNLAAISRKKIAQVNLQRQLEKLEADDNLTEEEILGKDKNIKRIKQELETLKSRI